MTQQSIPELSKLREILEQNYANGIFVYGDWMALSSMYPKGSRVAKTLRKKAARIEKERKINVG